MEESMPDADEHEAIKEAIKRDKELTSGEVQGLTRDETMQAARDALNNLRPW